VRQRRAPEVRGQPLLGRPVQRGDEW
jgi:hypothetical protein